jgi:hypothetical protein
MAKHLILILFAPFQKRFFSQKTPSGLLIQGEQQLDWGRGAIVARIFRVRDMRGSRPTGRELFLWRPALI